MLILPISSPNKCQLFAKIQIFIETVVALQSK